jgi:predicted Zn-ribbon and HTH transcriptional regulator
MAPPTLSRLLRSVPLFGRHRLAFFDGLPELAMFPTDAARESAVDAARRDIEGRRGFGLLHFGALMLLFIGLHAALARLLPGLGYWASVVAAVIAIAVVESGVYLITRRHAARRLRAALVEEGVAICTRCGYDLRRLRREASLRCPECGSPVPEAVAAIIAGDHAEADGPHH